MLGEVEKIFIRPRKATLGPGERICFRAFAVDEKGCEEEIEATWSAHKNKRSARGLISRSGCFAAGDTAADSEGRYSVRARAMGRRSRAEVEVVFPDLGELMGVRLEPAREIPDAGPASLGDTSSGLPGSSLAPLAEAPADLKKNTQKKSLSTRNHFAALWIAGLGLLVITAVLVLLLGTKKNRGQANAAKEPLNAPATSAKMPGNGVICPKCHRGYDPGARFCPHDSEKLIPYSDWRQNSRLSNDG